LSLKSAIALEDGTVIHGKGFGSEGVSSGELVFNTSMSGYQEALTDPSYAGQILLFTYPLVGNYGINSLDFESGKIHARSFVVREACAKPEHYASGNTLSEFLEAFSIPGVSGVDTRFLTKKVRAHGVMPAAVQVFSKGYMGDDSLLALARAQASYSSEDFVLAVTSKAPSVHDVPNSSKHVVLIDCGVKRNILKSLNAMGIKVTVVPADLPSSDILNLEPDGILVSNGPGDPERVTYAVDSVKKAIDSHVPVFGICLGHQILSIALGGKTFKLKFGHRGGNQPVKDLDTGRIFITSQNHGFATDPASMDGSEAYVSKLNLNDNTVEGLSSKEIAAFSVQYHPEASPGPMDSHYLFAEFMKLMDGKR